MSDKILMGQAPTPAVSMFPPPTGSLGLLSAPSLPNSLTSTTLKLIAPSQGQTVLTAVETGRVPIYSVAGVGWRRGVAVERRTRDREVVGSSLDRALRRKNSGQVSHT